MNKEHLKCAYCNKQEKETDDHVPPKSFYPTPRPSNLITVPSCLKCNQGLGKDEEFFLAIIMFDVIGVIHWCHHWCQAIVIHWCQAIVIYYLARSRWYCWMWFYIFSKVR
jgi:hypothetical protein